MPLIKYKVNISLEWYKNCILPSITDDSAFTITDTKLFVPVVNRLILLMVEKTTTLQKIVTENISFQE